MIFLQVKDSGLWRNNSKTPVFYTFSEKKGSKKEDAAPAILTGVFVFPNGDKYGKQILNLSWYLTSNC